jgi:hypothetical protein
MNMKAKHKDRHHSPPANYNEEANEEARNPDRNERVKQDHAKSQQKSDAEYDLVKKTLSGGYNPDGPGGNYRGV